MSSNTPLIARSKPANFNWEDPFLLEDQLTEEERMIRDTAKAYCQDKLLPRIIEANRNEVFHKEIMTEMGELGCLAQQYLKNLVALEQTIHHMA
jgi:glutaryl-CoA dehydrogenase